MVAAQGPGGHWRLDRKGGLGGGGLASPLNSVMSPTVFGRSSSFYLPHTHWGGRNGDNLPSWSGRGAPERLGRGLGGDQLRKPRRGKQITALDELLGNSPEESSSHPWVLLASPAIQTQICSYHASPNLLPPPGVALPRFFSFPATRDPQL